MKSLRGKLSSGWKSMRLAVTHWKQSRKSKRELLRKQSVKFNLEYSKVINHVVILEEKLYRVIIDDSSINVIDIAGRPVDDQVLIVDILREVKYGSKENN
ncbi:hypothetical protein Aerorivi_02403 [Aeromonas rivipollensis]|uniref:hypothetical protein n=1 Tax=Aeromonas TaxID=642 RepID=UPI00148AF174|nr:hypothetical protein [Aeromonas media]QJT27562.1 hypothetical protein E4185_16820 [Aeromonas media]